MKKNVLKFGLFALVLIGMVSCKNEEKEATDRRINELESYVDSLKIATSDDLENNWETISIEFEKRKMATKESMANLNEEAKAESQEKIDAVNADFDEVKVTVMTKIDEKKAMQNPNQMLRDKFFGSGKIGEDMNFAWVNKDNILSVYDNFFEAYKANKANFSREDYDEVKLMYEALDSRKNTVEKEGLSSSDNGKIASIKFKFGPMFAMNRIGAKTREMEKAKE